MNLFLAGLFSGFGLMAYFDRSVWMQTQRVMYDMDRAGRDRFARIKAKELEDINACRAANGLEPVGGTRR